MPLPGSATTHTGKSRFLKEVFLKYIKTFLFVLFNSL